MSKTYILKKDWFFSAYDSFNGKTYKAGEKLVRSSDLLSYYEFPDKVIVHENWVENNPEWFLPEEKEAEDGGIYKMQWDGHEYLLCKRATFVGRPAFLMSEKGNCIKRWVTELNSTDHWMCEPIGIVASSNKLLGLPTIKEYAKFAIENKSNDSFQWTDELVGELLGQYAPFADMEKSIPRCVDNFKQSHTPKPQGGMPLPSDYIFPDKISVLRSDGSIKTFPEAMAEANKLNPRPKYKVPNEIAENKPDWEIVEFIGKNSLVSAGSILERNKDRTFGMYHVEESVLLNSPIHSIHSVKRLSDGRVFSAGDEVIHFSDYYTEKIKEFVVPEKTPWQMWFHPERNPDTVKSLSNFTKSKFTPQPTKLFTTEDGVEVNIGSDGVLLDTDTWLKSPCQLPENPFRGDHNQFKYFSTKEAAEKYIADNKPFTKLSSKENDPVVTGDKFKRVLKTLKDNKVMVDTRKDGVYIRLAGNECDGYACSTEFVNAYPFQPKSKPQEQRIEVVDYEFDISEKWMKIHFSLPFICSIPMFNKVKKSVEQVLNDDGMVRMSGQEYFSKNFYTQQQVDELCEKAWKAARQRTGIPRNPTDAPPFEKYDTFQDYKNSLNSKQ